MIRLQGHLLEESVTVPFQANLNMTVPVSFYQLMGDENGGNKADMADTITLRSASTAILKGWNENTKGTEKIRATITHRSLFARLSSQSQKAKHLAMIFPSKQQDLRVLYVRASPFFS
jgi:hypothetical protein